jgi:hypothetical protein
MESFIVRVYRRSRTKPVEIAGLVETVGTDEKRAFQSFSGLINALRNAIFPTDNILINKVERVERDLYTKPEKKQAG